MVKVIGAVAEIVPLPDLNDRVFYQQEKSFSEVEYNKSRDLQREIKRGRLRVLSREDEKFSDYSTPSPTEIEIKQNIKKDQDQKESQELIAHIQNLERKISEKPQQQVSEDNSLIFKLLEKIDQLENKLSQVTNTDSSKLTEVLEKLENKISTQENDALIKRLENIISNAPDSTKSKQIQNNISSDDEIYVPSIQVEDGSSHIKLKTRTIEKSSNVDAAAEALRKLRNKS